MIYNEDSNFHILSSSGQHSLDGTKRKPTPEMKKQIDQIDALKPKMKINREQGKTKQVVPLEEPAEYTEPEQAERSSEEIKKPSHFQSSAAVFRKPLRKIQTEESVEYTAPEQVEHVSEEIKKPSHVQSSSAVFRTSLRKIQTYARAIFSLRVPFFSRDLKPYTIYPILSSPSHHFTHQSPPEREDIFRPITNPNSPNGRLTPPTASNTPSSSDKANDRETTVLLDKGKEKKSPAIKQASSSPQDLGPPSVKLLYDIQNGFDECNACRRILKRLRKPIEEKQKRNIEEDQGIYGRRIKRPTAADITAQTRKDLMAKKLFREIENVRELVRKLDPKSPERKAFSAELQKMEQTAVNEEVRINLRHCQETHELVQELRRELSGKEKRDHRQEDHGYIDNRYKKPIHTHSIEKALAVQKLIEGIDELSVLIEKLDPEDPEKQKLVDHVRELKQIFVFEEALKRNLSPVNAKTLYTELKVKPSHPRLPPTTYEEKWKELCRYFQIDSPSEIEECWNALKQANKPPAGAKGQPQGQAPIALKEFLLERGEDTKKKAR